MMYKELSATECGILRNKEIHGGSHSAMDIYMYFKKGKWSFTSYLSCKSYI